MILGISLSHDGTLTLLDDQGCVLYAVGEERLTRVKCYTGFPFEALKHTFSSGKYRAEDVRAVAVGSHSEFIPQMAKTFAFLLTPNKRYYDLINETPPADFFVGDTDWLLVKDAEQCEQYVRKKLNALLAEVGISAPLFFINHHLAHAASAYYASGFEDALAITMDGEGDYESATVSECVGGKITRIHVDNAANSVGNLYSEVTKEYGFKIARHEGKITGLAAYGNPRKFFRHFRKFVSISELGAICVDWKPTWIHSWHMKINRRFNRPEPSLSRSKWANIVKTAPSGKFADMAAGVQQVSEVLAVEYANFWLKRSGKRSLVLAGGIFANVKLNQKLMEIDGVDRLFIYPNMGDGGLAYGAARFVLAAEYGIDTPKKIDTVYYGDSYDEAEIDEALKILDPDDYVISKPQSLEIKVAQLLASGGVVGWFQDEMEYGPRALGHRSVIASPVDKSINKWLNDRMHRTEFMPFAPSCLYEAAETLFVMPKLSARFPAEFMTLTFDMRPEWINKAPAVAHVDGTARPQLVRKETNPKFHQVIQHFATLTGIPLVINTSFNAHEEPIVRRPSEAISALQLGMIDALAIGPWLVEKCVATSHSST